jgi:formylglycine-generating enzyme required for sulfatase activity
MNRIVVSLLSVVCIGIGSTSLLYADPPDNMEKINQIMSSWEGSIAQTSTLKKISSPNDGLYNSWPDTPANESAGDNTVSVPPDFHVYPGPPPEGMKLIPAGPFGMGAFFNLSYEMPAHTVTVSTFYLDTYEVTGALWEKVRNWAISRGYTDLAKGQAGYDKGGGPAGSNHPIVQVSWFDCVKWCNARSEMECLNPVYFMDSQLTNVYRSGIPPPQQIALDLGGNGYRLPTEAEWEKAARGSVAKCNYPWGNSINGSKANYLGSGDPFDDGTTPVGYYDGMQTILGQRQRDDVRNGLGLYDMAGNVYEWCWDWYDELPAETARNPTGPANGKYRVLRGGCWASAMTDCLLCSFRHYMAPSTASSSIGFRCARGM